MPGEIIVERDGIVHRPAHITKEQDIPLKAGDTVRVGTPGGGGYGKASERDPDAVLHDVKMEYYSRKQARELFDVVIGPDMTVDAIATRVSSISNTSGQSASLAANSGRNHPTFWSATIKGANRLRSALLQARIWSR